MSITLPLTIKITYDKNSKDAPYVAYTPELDVASCGSTEEKAKKNLQEVVEITLDSVKQRGNLNEFLEELGFEKEKQNWKAPRISFESTFFQLSF